MNREPIYNNKVYRKRAKKTIKNGEKRAFSRKMKIISMKI